jgi:hypothetical protein
MPAQTQNIDFKINGSGNAAAFFDKTSLSLGSLVKGAGAVAIATAALSAFTAGTKAYQSTLDSVGDAGLAQQAQS